MLSLQEMMVILGIATTDPSLPMDKPKQLVSVQFKQLVLQRMFILKQGIKELLVGVQLFQ